MRMRATAILLTVLLALSTAVAGNDSATYIGGTLTTVKQKTEGKLLLTDNEGIVFESKDGRQAIPYAQVNNLEYGQKAGRRYGLAMAISPVFLLSKKRQHYLSIGYLGAENKQQAAIFELGKGVIKDTLTGLEAKTGKTVEYENEEARKSVWGK